MKKQNKKERLLNKQTLICILQERMIETTVTSRGDFAPNVWSRIEESRKTEKQLN